MNHLTFAQPIAEHLERFNSYLRRQLRSTVPLLNLVLRYLFRRRGKQLRPILVFLSAGASGGISERTYVGATMVELLHTATLVHDDVVDNAPLRRGIASINAIWKNKIAVLVGDYLLARGLLIAIEHDEVEFLRITSHAVRRMSEGELLQLQQFRARPISEETYLRIISDKTAALFATCCQIGAVSADADPATQQLLNAIGERLGVAFQIRDDVLDYISRSSILGKATHHDIREGKFTLPLLRALQLAPASEARSIMQLVRSKPQDAKAIDVVVSFVERYGGIESAMQTATGLVRDAIADVERLPPSEYRDMLCQLARYTIERDQ